MSTLPWLINPALEERPASQAVEQKGVVQKPDPRVLLSPVVGGFKDSGCRNVFLLIKESSKGWCEMCILKEPCRLRLFFFGMKINSSFNSVFHSLFEVPVGFGALGAVSLVRTLGTRRQECLLYLGEIFDGRVVFWCRTGRLWCCCYYVI